MSLPNADQRAFWSEDAGDIWVAQARVMDAALAPVLQATLGAARLRAGENVVDIGCGAGTSTFAAADLVAPGGVVCGVDVSDPLLAAAQRDPRKSDQCFFIKGDAQIHAFDPGSFDVLISRFGVMFFEDTKGAFANMARWLKPGGRMAFATWGGIGENPFFTLPAGVAKAQFGPRDRTDPDAPGPFALRDTEKTCAVLRAAGLSDVAVDVEHMALTPEGGPRDLAALMCQIGPAQSALAHFEATEAERATLIDALTEAITPWQTPNGIRIPAEINIFTATKAS